jgi:hypothetical protein
MGVPGLTSRPYGVHRSTKAECRGFSEHRHIMTAEFVIVRLSGQICLARARHEEGLSVPQSKSRRTLEPTISSLHKSDLSAPFVPRTTDFLPISAERIMALE